MKISVIVPVYNAEKYLNQCIDSICQQTLKDIEIILVDDASTDGSLAILENYARSDCRVRIIQNTHIGEGAASARNAGLAVAQGEYLSFLDADDYFALDMLEKTYQRATETNADVVVFDGVMFQSATGQLIETGNILNYAKIPKKDVFSHHDFPDDIFTCTTSAAWSKIYKRTLIEQHTLNFQPIYYADDLLFVAGAFVMADRIVCIPEKFIYYRIGHTEAQTQNRAKAPLSSPQAFFALKELLQEKGVFDDVKNGYANAVIKRCAWNLNTLPTPKSFKTLYNALATEYLEKLEISTSLTKNMLPFDAFAWVEAIRKNDALAYGFCGDDYHRDSLFFHLSTLNHFPKDRIQPNEKVVLYGAGKVGKTLYIQNLLENYCELVAWVEEAPITGRLPYPLVAMDELRNIDFDTVLISVRNDQLIHDVSEAFARLNKRNIVVY